MVSTESYPEFGLPPPPPPASPTTTTTTTTTPIPSPTPSASQQPQPQSPQPGSFFSGAASTPLLAGFISIGAFALGVISICAWCRFMGRPRSFDAVLRRLLRCLVPAWLRRRGFGAGLEEEDGHGLGLGHGQGQRGRRRSRRQRGMRADELSRAKPEMFDAWIESVDNTLRWDAVDCVPLSATLFTGPVATAAAAEVPSRVGRDSVYGDGDEKHQCLPVQMRRAAAAGSGTLQVAVLVQMPSRPSHTVTEVQNHSSVRSELVIGLVEAPWTTAHPSSREGEGTTTS